MVLASSVQGFCSLHIVLIETMLVMNAKQAANYPAAQRSCVSKHHLLQILKIDPRLNLVSALYAEIVKAALSC